MRMKPPQEKAVTLVTSGAVDVSSCSWETADGVKRIRHALGLVASGEHIYTVTIDSTDGNTCTCHYGQAHTHLATDSHSHDTALRIAAERES